MTNNMLTGIHLKVSGEMRHSGVKQIEEIEILIVGSLVLVPSSCPFFKRKVNQRVINY